MRTLVLVVLAVSGCSVSTHATKASTLGTSSSSKALLEVLDAPGPVTVETVASCDWVVDRSGLINLSHEKAKAAGLTDGEEPIQVYFHVLRHPTKGTFIIDTGVEKALRDDPSKAAIRGFVASFMKLEKMKVHVALGDWVDREKKLDGVFLTHLHLDHVSGMADVPKGTPIYSGPGEAAHRGALNFAVQGSTDRAFAGQEPISELQFRPDPDGRFAGVIDVFGDGSVWALSVPGHTPGSVAFIARTPSGPVLFTGDTSHTAWGWQNGVDPGSFTDDHAANASALEKLRTLAAEHPAMTVRLGHQALSGTAENP
ncbi:MAG: MBL fold metallo-hydrolase [Myxococcaceae bacterium]|nr:MBL fold metallo-hydrolase [Myxococcaceae bacterium]